MADEKQMIKEELIRALKSYHNAVFTPGVYEHSILGKAALILENSVEVVRCKDCKHLYDRIGYYCCRNHSGLARISENSFCSYGERSGKT